MEAKEFGFGRSMPPALKFDPTDTDIVAYYLLPRALNLPNPYARAIIEDDPGSAPPWEILQRHGNLDHAFFFGPPTDPSHNGGRKNRTVKGGVWNGQKGSEYTVTLLRPGGGEVNIRFRRYDLSFSLHKRGRSTGYVMQEYEILSPPLPGTVLTRIRVPKKAANRHTVAPADAEQKVPDPEQYGATAVMSNGEGFGGAQDGAPYGGGMVEYAGYYGTPLQYELPLVEYDNNYCVSIPDQPGASYNYDAAAVMSNGEGFGGAQAGAPYGGGKVENAGYYGTPLQYELPLVEYDNNYCVSIPDQPGASYNYDAAAMMSNGEGFGGAQDGAPYGGGMVENARYYCTPLQRELPLVEHDNNYCVSIPDQPGVSYNYDAAAMNGEGFTAAPADAFNGGGMLENADAYFDPSGYVPERGTDYSNYYGEYQQWKYQQDRSNQYQAGDAGVGKVFSGEQQASALCGNSDKGSVVGTETSAHSTISLCGDDGEVDLDDISFYKMLFDDDDFNCEPNKAGDPANEPHS